MKAFLRRGIFIILRFALRPFGGVRAALVKGLLLASEGERNPEASLMWLLNIHAFVEGLVDRNCVAWGNGVHVKHDIMDGIHSFFFSRVPPGARVLDVGCGIGALAYAIVEHSGAAEVTGMDLNAGHIRFASARFQHPRLRFIHGDALHDLPAGSADVIVMSSVLEHVENRICLLRYLVARYRPKAVLLRVPTLERHCFVALKKRLGLPYYADPDHKTEYTRESFLSEMKGSGLVVVYLEVRWGDIWAECRPEEETGGE